MIPYRGKVTLERTLKYIEENKSYIYINSLINYDYSELKFRLNEEEISEIILRIVDNDLSPEFLTEIAHLCEYFNISLVYKENYHIFNEFVDLLIKNEEIFPQEESLDKLLNSFNDKKIALEFLKYVFSNKTIGETLENSNTLDHFINYLIKARQYYVDDRALLSSAINLVNLVDDADLMFSHDEDINKVVEQKLLDDKKSNGIYDIDQFTLEELDRKLAQFQNISTQLECLVEMTEQQIKTIREESKKSNDDIAKIRIQTLKTLKTEANKVLSNFKTTYLELLNKEKESILNQKDILMADIETEFQKKALELEALASSVGQRIAIELGRIRQQSDYSLEKMQEFISNNEEVKKMFQVAKEDQAFLSRLAKMDSIPVTPVSAVTGAQSSNSVVGIPSIILPNPERQVVEKINYYFDRKIPFKDRFNELMAKKQEDIDKTGAIYHEKFDDLVTIVLNNDTPYMYGPSGCGKTYMIEKQLARILGLDVVTNGFIMYETDILGFNNANGVYVPSNFYRCYKFGDMIFLDELDNSNPVSTIVLNSFIGKDEDSAYTFPNGDRIKRHPNFRILAAGNTRGNGKTESHNTRQKLDEAVMQRLTPIEIDYDNRIEKQILRDYPDWYNFAVNFREALKAISIDGTDGPNYNGTITTRDIEAIKRYKDDDSFSDEKIIEYEVIENKDADYLSGIITEMENLERNGEFTDGASVLLEKFKTLSMRRKY